MARLYICCALIFVVLIGIAYLYNVAYDKGYATHKRETEQKAVQCVIDSRKNIVNAGEAVQKAQKKIEKVKTKDETCRDIMSFDIRQCLH